VFSRTVSLKEEVRDLFDSVLSFTEFAFGCDLIRGVSGGQSPVSGELSPVSGELLTSVRKLHQHGHRH
jgi:hypothetical protein